MPLCRTIPAIAVGATILLSPLVLAPPAVAHASVLDVSPSDGARLTRTSATTLASVTFDEVVETSSSGLRVRSATGAVLTAGARRTIISGEDEDRSRVSARTRSSLPAGRYALEYSIVSADGHRLTRAFGFAVSAGTPASSTATVPMARSSSGAAPRVTISGTRVGARSIRVRMPSGTRGGQVQLTCTRSGSTPARVSAPFIWRLGATSGGYATARGYLPTPCRYTVSVTVERPFPGDPSAWRSTSALKITS